MDIIKDSTERLGFELDVHWIQRGGENPVTYIQQFADRIKLIHLKDYRIKLDLSLLAGELSYEKIGAAFSSVDYVQHNGKPLSKSRN